MLGRSTLLAATNTMEPWQGNYNNVSLLLRNGTPGGSPLDESPTPKTIGVTSPAQVTTAVFKYGSSSLYIPGSGGFSASYGADLNLAGDDFTIEAWVAFAALFGLGVGATLVSRYTTTAKSYLWWAYRSQASGLYFLYFDWTTDNNTRQFAYAAIPTPSINVFSHYAVCRSGNEILFFVDGQKQTLNGQSSPIGTFFNQSTSLEVGTAYAGLGASAFNGYIDDLRITKGVARYTGNFNPPPVELPNF